MAVGTFDLIRVVLRLEVFSSTLFCALALGSIPAGAQVPVSAVISTDGLGRRSVEYGQNLIAALGTEARQPMQAVVEPNERSVVNFRAGLHQVIVGRQATFDQVAPGSHRVSTPIMSMDYMAVSAVPLLKLQQWSDLRNLSVGYVFGNRYVMKAIEGIARRTEATPTSLACLAMAAQRRVDICVMGISALISRPDRVDGVQLYDSKVDSVELFIWTHPDYGPLAEQLNAALQTLYLRGEIGRLQVRAD